MPKTAQVKKEFEGEWLSIVVTKREEEQSVEGDLVFHSKDERKV